MLWRDHSLWCHAPPLRWPEASFTEPSMSIHESMHFMFVIHIHKSGLYHQERYESLLVMYSKEKKVIANGIFFLNSHGPLFSSPESSCPLGLLWYRCSALALPNGTYRSASNVCSWDREFSVRMNSSWEFSFTLNSLWFLSVLHFPFSRYVHIA